MHARTIHPWWSLVNNGHIDSTHAGAIFPDAAVCAVVTNTHTAHVVRTQTQNEITNVYSAMLVQLPKLERLYLGYNRIEYIPHLSSIIESCPNLVELDLSHNNIQSIGTSLSMIDNRLERLDLSWNNITDLAPDTFTNLNELKCVGLAGCGLVSIEPLRLDLPNLQTLDLSYNRITNLAMSFCGWRLKGLSRMYVPEQQYFNDIRYKLSNRHFTENDNRRPSF